MIGSLHIAEFPFPFVNLSFQSNYLYTILYYRISLTKRRRIGGAPLNHWSQLRFLSVTNQIYQLYGHILD